MNAGWKLSISIQVQLWLEPPHLLVAKRRAVLSSNLWIATFRPRLLFYTVKASAVCTGYYSTLNRIYNDKSHHIFKLIATWNLTNVHTKVWFPVSVHPYLSPRPFFISGCFLSRGRGHGQPDIHAKSISSLTPLGARPAFTIHIAARRYMHLFFYS